MVIQLALWSVCLDPDQHMFRIENRAEVEEYESKLREKEAKRAGGCLSAVSAVDEAVCERFCLV